MADTPKLCPGIVYGHLALSAKGLRSSPIVLLAPPTDDNLYVSRGGLVSGRTLYERAQKPKGRKRQHGGWPAAGLYAESPRLAEDLLSLTLDDFLAVEEPRAGGFRFILVTRLSHIRGPYEEVARAEREAFEEEQRKRAERERVSHTVSQLAASGIRIDRRFTTDQIEAIAALVSTFTEENTHG